MLALLALSFHPRCVAGETATVEEHEKRIKELEQQLHDLTLDQRKMNAAVETQQAAKPTTGWLDGFVIGSTDGKHKLKIGAYTQADGRFFLDDTQERNTNQFLFRRVRPDIQGTVFRYFDFRLVPDFAGSSFTLFDAYVDFTYLPEAKVRAGKFKPPVGLERLQSATSTMFIERGLPTNLVPTRDTGLQLFGDLWDAAFSYQLGIFNGASDAGNSGGDLNDDKDFAGRIFAHPFKAFDVVALRGLGVGLSGSFGHQRGTSVVSGSNAPVNNAELSSYRSFGQAAVFSYSSGSAGTPATTTCNAMNVCTTTPAVSGTAAAVAQGDRSRLSPQLYYYYGAFGLLAEYVSSRQEVARPGPRNPVGRHTLDHRAWQVAASYVLTGEPASYRGVAPFQPLDPFEGKWGAFEVAARYGALDIDGEAFEQGFANRLTSVRQVTEYVAGLNWYLNKNIKLVLNYAQSEFVGGAGTAAAPKNRRAEQAIVTRVQLAF